MRTYTVIEYEKEDYQNFKDNLTDEKAIDILERISRGWLPNYNFSGEESDFRELLFTSGYISCSRCVERRTNK